MKKSFRQLLNTVLFVLITTFFCSVLSTPVSFGIPLKCPQGSKVIGIECFDEAYNNTTPWYRKDFGASKLTFPFWLAGFSVIAIWTTVVNRSSSAQDTENKIDINTAVPNKPRHDRRPKISDVESKRWLPVNCPNCGGSISIKTVEWISSYEAKCPYCGSILKEK